MTLDRTLAVLGLVASVLGLLSVPRSDAGWVALVVGLALLAYALYRLRQPALRKLYVEFAYDLSRSRDVVAARKCTVYKVNRKGISRLDAGGLTSTGEQTAFRSNLPGRLNITKDEGGALRVVCDLENALPSPSTIAWILAYDLLRSFVDAKEEVGFTCLGECRQGALRVTFSPKQPPIEVWKVISRNAVPGPPEYVRLSNDLPEIYWRFPIKQGLVYSINWRWPNDEVPGTGA